MKIHQLDGQMQQIYLVEYPDKLLLLDGACRPDAQKIVDYIANDLSRPITDLKLVVVTHIHPDHAGAARLLQKLTGCLIAGRKLSKHWYSGIDGMAAYLIDLYLGDVISRRMKNKRHFLAFNPFITPDIDLADGETLPFFDDWQAIHTSGHTDRDISLYHAKTRQMYVADLFIKTRRGFITPFPVHLPDSYRASLHKVWKIAPSKYLLAHGGKTSISQPDKDALKRQCPTKPRTIRRFSTRMASKRLKRLKVIKVLRHLG